MKSNVHLTRTVLLTVALFSFVMCGKKEEPQSGAPDTTATAMQQQPATGDRGTASATFGSATVSINYGRPQLQGRDMLAQASDGMVWRMGMNEATELKTAADLKFGETTIPKGSYSLWMKKVSGDNWQLVFNKKTGVWGTEHSPADDVAALPLTMSTNPEPVETFTIELASTNDTAGTLKAMWGTSVLSADFTVVQ